MIWLGWRQQRTETIVATAILAALAALLIPTGLTMASAFDDAGLSSCVGHAMTGSCGQGVSEFIGRFDKVASLIDWVTLIPGLIGILLAAPFTLQLERGTYRLDWTQSITRSRWITVKLGLAVAAGLAAAALLTLLITWWRAPLVRLEGRMNNSVFDAEGTVVFGYTLFALGLALVIGVVWRRAVIALVAAFAVYFASRLFVDTWLRSRLVHTVSMTWPARGGREPASLANAWVVSEYPSDKFGHPLRLPPESLNCDPCPAGKGIAPYMHTVFHPASQFWTLQAVETAMFGGVALALVAFAGWWSLRRIA